MRLRWLTTNVIIMIGVLLANTVSAVTYNMTDLGTLGGSFSYAESISSNGNIVGYSQTANGSVHAFLWKDGVMQDLGTLGDRSYATAVNSKGEVVGYSTVNHGTPHAFIWRNGKMDDLGTLVGLETIAFDINDNSQIVGYSLTSMSIFTMVTHTICWQNESMQDLGIIGGISSYATSINEDGDVAGAMFSASANTYRPFILQQGTVTELDTLPGGYGYCYANDINNNGWVVGIADDAYNRRHSFLWRNGTMEDIGTLGGASGEAFAINNSGLIVGKSNIAPVSSAIHAYVWENGVMSDLGLSSQYSSSAKDINDNGWIVGVNNSRAVLWTPVPEPSSFVVLLGAVVSVCYAKRRK